MINDQDLFKLLLPELLVEHFDITKVEQPGSELHLYFEEKITIPREFSNRLLESKGFLPEITIEDFPLRGKSVKLHIKRRRWTDKITGAILQRDWQLVSKGTRMTQDFAGFLKKISRY